MKTISMKESVGHLLTNTMKTIKANTSKNHINYEIKTKIYKRHPDKEVRVEFAKITGHYSKSAIKNMNYILEKEAFRIATNFIMTDDKLNNTVSVNGGKNHTGNSDNGSFLATAFNKCFIFLFVVRRFVRFYGCMSTLY
jgi:hypothetical protein